MNPPPELSTYPLRAGSGAPDDMAVIRQIADGDGTALALLYDQWVQSIYSLAMHLLRDADEAEDVVEETFWQVWQRAATYDPARGTVRTWLLTIARSRTLDRMRSRNRQREQVQISDVTLEHVSFSDSDPLLDAEGQERRTLVQGALAALPDEQRQALELGYFRGLSQSEIAETLSLPIGTVKTRMRLGMMKLRDSLGMLREMSREARA